MKVLTDYAHEDLYESMAILFEDRFGWELFRPIGMEWFDEGYWQFEKDRLGDAVARQFLQTWHNDEPLARGWSLRQSEFHPKRTQVMVTLEQARAMQFDVVISTIVANEPGLHRFAQENGAKYGIQIGNQDAYNDWSKAQFALSSIKLPFTPTVPHVTYHQEFSLEDFRYEWPAAEADLVATRVQCFATTPEYDRFRRVAGLVPRARFRHFGHCGVEDELFGGNAMTCAEVAEQVRDTRVVWHDKRWSDGYGHVIHQAFAAGRPVIGSAGYYADKLAGPLFVEGVTSFDMDLYSDDDLAKLVTDLLTDDDYHRQMSQQAALRFREVVSFPDEAAAIATMFESVL